MINSTDKLAFSIVTALIIASIFSMYELYFSSYFSIPKNMYIVVQFMILTLPMAFFLINTEDGFYGFLVGFFYYIFKALIIGFVQVSSFCLMDAFIFSFSVMIVGFGMGFQKEQTLKNAKLSMLGIFVILLAYVFSLMMILIYFNSYSGIMCYSIPHFRIS